MKHTILFLAANPLGTDRLALDREAHAIQVELERSGFRDRFELVTRWAAEPLDLLRELRKLKPTVVHFSGHGGLDAAGGHPADRAPPGDAVDEPDPRRGELRHGLVLQGSDGHPQRVSTAALEETFGAAGASVKLVVLNACYSDPQARALLPHVDSVVGMTGAIRDSAARSFAIGFYGGLGERESIAAAYRHGCAAISLDGLRDRDRPRLAVRDGVDASKLVLAADPAAAAPIAVAPAPGPVAAPRAVATCAQPIAILAGKRRIAIASDLGEWLAIADDGALRPLPATGAFAAAIVDATGVITVATWDRSLRQLRGDAWSELALTSPALALAASERGVICGDLDGGLSLLSAARSQLHELTASSAILELATAGGTVVVIDGAGRLASTAWPARRDPSLRVLDASAIGRPFSLALGPHVGTLIAIGERGIAEIDDGRVTRTVTGAGIHAVVPFRGREHACVITDSGDAWIIDGTLDRVARVRSRIEIEGGESTPEGGILIWTRDGDLHALSPEGTSRLLLAGDVVVAIADPDVTGGYIAVQWTAAGGPRVARGSTRWT